MIYRVLIQIATSPNPIPAGYIGPLALPEMAIKRFLERDIIAEVHLPPLGIFPQWKERSQRLHEAHITEEELITNDVAELANRLGIEKEEVLAWRADFLRILTV